MTSPARPPLASVLLTLAEIAAIAAAYFIIARGSLALASVNLSASPVWPLTGLAISLALMRGDRVLIGVLLGSFAANYVTTPAIGTAAAIAFGNALEAFAAAALLRRFADGERVFHSANGIVRFALVVSAIAAPISATIGVSALALTGYASWPSFAAIWTTWWLGNLSGAILVAPALLLWTRTFRGLEGAFGGGAAVLTFASAALVGLIAFSPLSPAPAAVRGALAFLAVAPLLAAALRLGLRDTATTALIISCLAIWGVLAGSSPFAQSDLNSSLLLLAAFIVATTLPALALAADRREAQSTLAQTREELAQAQKLEVLGQLTGGVAHDFNNLLMIIAGGVRALKAQELERAKSIEAISQALDRGTDLTRQLLGFVRREPHHAEVLRIEDAIGALEPLIRQSAGSAVAVETRLGAGLWPIKVDRNQFDLALLNLAVNARDAMPEGGRLTIRAENVLHNGVRHVAIAITDGGVGMEPDVAKRAFEPFFSTKPAGHGTGLGLAQVYSFARRAGGEASIESEPGAGTTVTLTLPAA